MTKTLAGEFKIYPNQWEHPYNPDQLLSRISFVFTMRGFPGLYFKLKEPITEDLMDCFQFQFDRDNGLYIQDGDMRFNDFMGEQITDSGADAIGFIKNYLEEHNLSNLISSSPVELKP